MTATQISEVSAKRASTTDSLVAEAEAASPLTKKPRVEEEGDGNMEDESEGESESESEEEFDAEAKAKSEAEGRVRVGKYVRFSYVPEPEPEWDVDSFEGREYESDPDFHSRFATENDYQEFRNQRIQALKNRGFLPDPFKHICAIQDMDEPAGRNMTNREYLAYLAKLCVKELNEKKKKTVEFVEIVRGNTRGGGRWKVYITFVAREYPNGPLVEYQAKAMDFAGESRPPFPILCRPVPKPAPIPLF